jgi:hypothetical protein
MDIQGTPVMQTPPIQLELQRLEKQHTEILSIVAAMEDRLSVVMTEYVPSKTPPIMEEKQTQSQLLSLISSRRMESEAIAYRLAQIINRLQV